VVTTALIFFWRQTFMYSEPFSVRNNNTTASSVYAPRPARDER